MSAPAPKSVVLSGGAHHERLAGVRAVCVHDCLTLRAPVLTGAADDRLVAVRPRVAPRERADQLAAGERDHTVAEAACPIRPLDASAGMRGPAGDDRGTYRGRSRWRWPARRDRRQPRARQDASARRGPLAGAFCWHDSAGGSRRGARGTFAYGIVHQLFEPVLARADPDTRAELLSGSARLAAPLFDPSQLAAARSASGERSFVILHGLYWLIANLALSRGRRCSRSTICIGSILLRCAGWLTSFGGSARYGSS